MLDRHPDDKPILIKNKEEWIEHIGSHILVWRYLGDDRPKPSNKEKFEQYKGWIEDPEEYPCMVYTTTEDVDFRPGIDIINYFFYLEDARELYTAKFLGEL